MVKYFWRHCTSPSIQQCEDGSKKVRTHAGIQPRLHIIQEYAAAVSSSMKLTDTGSGSYRPSVEISVEVGAVMIGVVIANVLASKAPTISVGQKVFTFNAGWAELAITNAANVTLINLPNGAKLTDSLGILGFSGLCAYFGLIKEADIKAGDFVVISGAAGAIGTAACQIALLKGAKVLGTVGTDDKVSYLKELGCDALNYKDKDFAKKFEQKTDGLIDVFFDNVGGKILDLALSRAKPRARFVLCGGMLRRYSASG